jgi:glycosyltransferase involved in cell wall biosynthesis
VISVVIPTFNGWPLLQRTLACALGQEGVQLEVIVVDDGSSDETPVRVRAWGDPRLRLLPNAETRGPSGGRNTGIAAAQGDWIAFLDHDDLWAPDKLKRQLEQADLHGADFVYTAGIRVSPALEVLHVDAPATDPAKIADVLLHANPIAGGASSPIARTGLVRAVGGFDPTLRYIEDWVMWLRLATVGERAACCDELLVAHTVHPRSMVLTHVPDIDAELAHFSAKHERLLAASGVRVNGLEVYRWIATTNWNAGRRGAAVRLVGHALRRHGRVRELTFAARQVARAVPEALQRRGPVADPPWIEQLRAAS